MGTSSLTFNPGSAIHVLSMSPLARLTVSSSSSSFFFFLFVFLPFSRAVPEAHGGSQARGPVGAAATGPRQRHSNSGSEPSPQPTPQLTATPDPQPTEKGQRWDRQPRGSQSGLSTTEPQRELLTVSSSIK